MGPAIKKNMIVYRCISGLSAFYVCTTAVCYVRSEEFNINLNHTCLRSETESDMRQMLAVLSTKSHPLGPVQYIEWKKRGQLLYRTLLLDSDTHSHPQFLCFQDELNDDGMVLTARVHVCGHKFAHTFYRKPRLFDEDDGDD